MAPILASIVAHLRREQRRKETLEKILSSWFQLVANRRQCTRLPQTIRRVRLIAYFPIIRHQLVAQKDTMTFLKSNRIDSHTLLKRPS